MSAGDINEVFGDKEVLADITRWEGLQSQVDGELADLAAKLKSADSLDDRERFLEQLTLLRDLTQTLRTAMRQTLNQYSRTSGKKTK